MFVVGAYRQLLDKGRHHQIDLAGLRDTWVGFAEEELVFAGVEGIGSCDRSPAPVICMSRCACLSLKTDSGKGKDDKELKTKPSNESPSTFSMSSHAFVPSAVALKPLPTSFKELSMRTFKSQFSTCKWRLR